MTGISTVRASQILLAMSLVLKVMFRNHQESDNELE